MDTKDPIVIVGAARTPIGSFQGIYSHTPAPQLGAAAIKSALLRASVNPTLISEVLMGCVLPGGVGQAPARQAALAAGIPQSVGATTLNKVCGSGLKAIQIAHDLIRAGSARIMVAGGMENMTKAPYLLGQARSGYRMGHGELKDHLFLDGLEDAYETGKLMGVFAERTAEKYQISRKAQDAYALTSLERALTAEKNKAFLSPVEITPFTLKLSANQIIEVTADEQPSKVNKDKIPLLKPVFQENGTVTAANSSSISDGAAAVILMKLSEANELGIKPLAKILGHASYAIEPSWFTIAPVGAIQALLNKLQWTTDTPHLYEINEAFAVVTLAILQDLKISPDKVNIHGGACALGHPLGATGARIVCTLLGALKARQQSFGIAALCLGGGEAVAIAIENLEN